ncbi:MAG: hypothetical protein DLM50_04890 [Candidatus Meridianibacter frigidus]|nr:MAG: hypothetical protein DLM50_04890 [Candidatus Eremiobacteraeota bacterium]
MERIAITANGPGEIAGWVRPLLTRLFEAQPALEVHLFLVPDDYATGREAQTVAGWFPQVHVYEGKATLRALLGAGGGVPAKMDFVQYLGGDLMHAARLARRSGAAAATYKFSRPAYRELFVRAFAIDLRNVEELAKARVHRDRIVLTGNLAIDGALMEAELPAPSTAPRDGILILPGSRRYEVEQGIPFFFTVAAAIKRVRSDVEIAFGISPFTPMEDVRQAIAGGGHPRVYAMPGRFMVEGGQAYLTDRAETVRFAVLRNALPAAKQARMVITMPGTKTIELAALGKAMLAVTPLNVAEMLAINGPLTYLNRLPVIGERLKRAVVVAAARRFTYFTQPNMDAGRALIAELRGTLTPGRVATVALERFDDRAWLEDSAQALRSLYVEHAGAARRMARGILECAA